MAEKWSIKIRLLLAYCAIPISRRQADSYKFNGTIKTQKETLLQREVP